MNIRNILLATDLSDNARKAYQCAVSLASNLNSRLHLVHFASATPFAGVTPRFADMTTREPLFDALEEALADEINEHTAFDGIDVQPRLEKQRWTRKRQRTLERELDIDLIVVSPQGRTGLAKMLLGSFADRVIRHSSVPVLLIRPTEGSETLALRTVLVPHGFYDRTQTILPAMRWLDSHFNCAFRFLHVYDSSWTTSRTIQKIEQQFAQSMISIPSLTVEERFAKLLDEDLQGLDAVLETAQGTPSVRVVQRANQMSADLVLLGIREGLGSVARRVTREAKCSVLTVPVTDAKE